MDKPLYRVTLKLYKESSAFKESSTFVVRLFNGNISYVLSDSFDGYIPNSLSYKAVTGDIKFISSIYKQITSDARKHSIEQKIGDDWIDTDLIDAIDHLIHI